ncbi:MSL1 isoform 6, partial [Pongo abelii]
TVVKGCESKHIQGDEMRVWLIGGFSADCGGFCSVPELLARIERMERRMQLVKKDNEKERHKLFQGYETEEREETELSEKIKLECQPELSETSQTLPPKPFSCGRSGKGHKRKSPFG